jgi:hypothetical protein
MIVSRATFAAAAALAVVTAAPASAGTSRTTEDVSGETFACATNTYTLHGSITIVQHDSLDAQGRQHSTGTVTTTGVTATDAAGNTYSVRGTQWFGFNDVANGGVASFTFHLNFIAPGRGTVDTVRVQDHFGPNGEIIHDRSTCVD